MRTSLPSLALSLLAACGLLTACGDAPKTAKAAGPTKADIVAVLHALAAAVAAGDTDAAMAMLHPMPEEKMREATRTELPELLAREGVTKSAIDKLAKRGVVGPLAELWPELGPFWARKAGADVAQCYGLKSGRARVAVHWGEHGARLIYVETIDKS